MPKPTRNRVFLSYAHEDLKISQKIEQTLRKKEIPVWRDQQSLYGGQQWPKAIGEAISSSDFFILVWSRHSAFSHFEKFEWNTAVALEKTIIPCLLDDTPLPNSLRAINGIYLKDFENDFLKIFNTLQATVQEKDAERSSEVIKKLAAIQDLEPAQVVNTAKSIFSNEGWSERGNI